MERRRRRTKAEMEAARSAEKVESPIEEVNEAPKEPKIHTGSDAVINIKISMPDREPKDYSIRVKNVKGTFIGKSRNPDGFFEKLFNAIKREFPGVV